MRAVIQRVSRASVTVEGEIVGEIGRGMLVLLGVTHSDTSRQVEQLAEKIVGLRIFDDEAGKMNLALADVGGAMLVVSQFTLLGDCRRGRRPSYTEAARPELANQLYEEFIEAVRRQNVTVATGQFRTHMDVALVNDGPVTLIVDSW